MTEEPDIKDRYRMDFIQEPVMVPVFVEAEEDDEDAVELDGKKWRISHVELQFQMKPHPDRYERVEDSSGWLDTLDNTFIPDEELEPMLNELEGAVAGQEGEIEKYYDPPEIEDTSEYVAARKKEIKLAISGKKPLQTVNPDRKNLKKSIDENVKTFVIMSIDLVSSTALGVGMGNERFATMIQIYMMECSQLIHNFHGQILNIAGDGIIAYFPGPNVVGMHDNAIDCAISLSYLIRQGLNEVFRSSGYPELKFRIGLNTGNPEIISEGEDSYNILGNSVNFATSIQKIAKPNEILLGEFTARNLHTRWRKNITKVTEDRDWEFALKDEIYDVYKYNVDGDT